LRAFPDVEGVADPTDFEIRRVCHPLDVRNS
jgi:hypothetical protein